VTVTPEVCIDRLVQPATGLVGASIVILEM